MRILIVSAIYPPDIGGPATYCAQMRRGLLDRGHEVTVLAGGEQAGETAGLIRIRRERPFFWINAIARLAVQDHDVALVAGMYDMVSLAWRRPWVAKIGGDEAWERAQRYGQSDAGIDEFQSNKDAPAFKTIRTRSLRHARTVIAPSRYLTRLAGGWGIRNVERVHNGIEPPPSDLDRTLCEPPLLVSAGRLVPHKRFAELAAMVPEGAQLEIYGEGPEKLPESPRVRVLQPVPRDRLLRRIARAHAFVLNSTYEGFPHLAIEAMSVGTPVVATDVGGTAEVLGDAGILVRDDMPAALKRILGDRSLRERLSAASLARAGEFGLDRMIDRTEALLARACDQGVEEA